mgnify:CR=1 FL=1
MITADPYGISGAVAPWRSLDAMEPIVERNITERDAEEAAICGQCPLPDCNPKRVGCLLHTRAKKPKPSRDLLSQATGYSISTTAMYMKEFFKAGPCKRCSSKSICDAAGGTCSRKERWKAVKEESNDGR